ncbi:hypothetical protein [Chroococcidiopsis sp. CCMEE 29]|uniref:hypothetical protein n=1 Tax=Chroococcidiopsis sp. CCMEE 29 TaxID=155894 RepID=UPI00202055F1|nr:hypothetical protein [Chroococcidiopsis sp. CCMEE 29]
MSVLVWITNSPEESVDRDSQANGTLLNGAATILPIVFGLPSRFTDISLEGAEVEDIALFTPKDGKKKSPRL